MDAQLAGLSLLKGLARHSIRALCPYIGCDIKGLMLTVIGIASGVVTLLVFLTGRPSVFHFLPIRYHLKELLPSPYVRWKFIVKENTLFLRHKSLEVAVLPHLNGLKDYRIFSSTNNSKFLILYKYSFEKRFVNLLVINSDGSNREEHRYPSGIVDARWFSPDAYLIYLETASEYDHENKYPYFWTYFNPETLGLYTGWDRRIRDGNYLVQLNAENEIIGISNY
jgi:hypothetical protein